MIEARHLVTESGETYAVVVEDELVLAAVEVEEVDLDSLEDQAGEAIELGDAALASQLADALATGAATLVGAYFEVSV